MTVRRKDREVTDHRILDDVLTRATVCHLAMVDKGEPYVVPLSFGYENGVLYFHGAREGRKVRVLEHDARVCFNVFADEIPETSDIACGYGVKYRSVSGTGTAEFITDPSEKRHALDTIMRKFATGHFTYPDATVGETGVIRVVINSMTGKAKGYPLTAA